MPERLVSHLKIFRVLTLSIRFNTAYLIRI